MKRTIAYILSLLCAVSAGAKGHYFRHLGIYDGLSQVCIPSIYQDEIGAMWFGTSEGLNRYNGKDVKIFRPSVQGGTELTVNEINGLCGDRRGHMYIRSGSDLVKFDLYRERFTVLRRDDVRGMYCDGDTLWVSCRDGIYSYAEGSDSLAFVTALLDGAGTGEDLIVDEDTIWVATSRRLVAVSRRDVSKQRTLVRFNRGKCLASDASGGFWIGTWEGVFRVAADGGVTHYTSQGLGRLSDNQVRCIVEDDSKRIWIGTFRGLDCYDPAADRWSHYTRYGDSSNTLSHHSVLSLHKDRQGNIWVGTYYGGVNVFDPDNANNHFFYAEPMRANSLSFPVVGKMTEDGQGNLWICTEGGGLNRYDTKTEEFTRYQWVPGDPGSVGSNNLKAIYYHPANDRLYVGTHFGGLFILDLASGRGHSLHARRDDDSSLPHEIVNDIQEYRGGLALLTQGGPVFMDPVTETFSPVTRDDSLRRLLSREYAFETFLIDSHDRMWLAWSNGGVICVNLSTSEIDRYDDPSSYGRFKVVHIFEDSTGDIYFSSIGSGVFRYSDKEGVFDASAIADGNLSDYCYYVCESVGDGRLYILHNGGLSVYDRETGRVEDTRHMFHQTYSQGSAVYRDGKGLIYVSGTNGLALFREESLYATPESFLGYDKLFVYNREISPADETGILTDILARTSDIRLSYKQNNVTVEFAPFDYNGDFNRMYEYCLDGFDNSWTQTSGTTITYTNLPPGNYTLRTRAADNRDAEISLGVHVSAPFYATVWAYLLYLLVLVGIIAAILRLKTRQIALKSSLEYERKEKERIEELNRIKLTFFTNISHEFRTPLTLILGQIELLMQMDQLGTTVYNRILRIYKNAWHMRDLISELLDFRKQEQGYLKLRVEEHDIVSFTRQIYMCFYEYAHKKDIVYRFDSVEESLPVWFDQTQLQKVIFNLLSNAFKYTPPQGAVTVGIRRSGKSVCISVRDTGAGIPEKDIYKIFDRFYQAGNSSLSFTPGTGIGLALSKGIMDLHHGRIDVKSEVGNGSSFTLTLQLGKGHFNEDELARADDGEAAAMPEVPPVVPVYSDAPAVGEVWSEEADNKPAILIVEDNDELLAMLRDVFESMYKVHVARNGREGLEAAQQLQPDLIVSDVMMPEMSGKEMCYKIKNNVALSHISIVLLTAQTSADYMVEGFMFGADDYVTKPFNVKVLLARCNNLIRNKKRMLAHYAGKPMMETPEVGAVSERDKKLMERCVAVIRNNFDNSDFNVMTLASELCVSRSKLYVELKRMTGLTPNEFILKIKLDEAMQLLKNAPELNISEIALKLGFSSARYFSRTFKSFFGSAPQSVRSKKSDTA